MDANDDGFINFAEYAAHIIPQIVSLRENGKKEEDLMRHVVDFSVLSRKTNL